jgi:hypothetical protein
MLTYGFCRKIGQNLITQGIALCRQEKTEGIFPPKPTGNNYQAFTVKCKAVQEGGTFSEKENPEKSDSSPVGSGCFYICLRLAEHRKCGEE